MGSVQLVCIRTLQGNFPASQERGGASVNSSRTLPSALNRRAQTDGSSENDTLTDTPSLITIPAPMLPELEGWDLITGEKYPER